jgi:hypothetical protein
MSPRPILKRLPALQAHPTFLSSTASLFPFSTCSSVLPSPHVHFPPTPILTSTYAAYSPSTYDRAPIEVMPNACALPQRGGRIYTPVSPKEGEHRRGKSRSRKDEAKGCYFRPLASQAWDRAPTPPPTSVAPDLVHQYTSSSESSESEENIITPTVNPSLPISPSSHPPIPRIEEDIDHALSFLPHPSSLVKDSDAAKCRRRNRSHSPSFRRVEVVSSFVTPALDGCLGGF